MDIGFIGGIIGGILGVVGGIIGTYCSIANTQGPQERKFMIKASIICWLAITLFLVVLLNLPSPHRWFIWILYGVSLPLGIITINKGVAKIRAEEAAGPTQPS